MRTEISEMWSELSASQRSLWISYQKAPHLRGGYNIAFCPRILGDVDPNLISHTLKLLMAHHPMLRATFRNGDDGPQQRILPLDEAPFFLHDASSWSETALRQHIEAEYRRPFDDDKPLVRAHLYRISARESVLLWVIDHLICDGNTFWILMEEWSALLAQKTLLPLETVSDDPDFFSYVAHQAAWLESPQGKKQFEYWKQTFSGAGATGFDLQLASDSAGSSMPRPRSQSFAVSDEQMGGLSALAAKYGTSLFEVLLASYFIFLRKYTAQNTIMVGSPMPARGQGPWRNTVGNCTHVVPIMAHFDTDLTIGELLTALHATVRQAKRNRHYPFELMIERLPIHRPSAQHAYIQTQFTYQVDRGATGVMKLMVGTVCGPDENRTDATVSWGGWDTVSYPVQISHSDIGNLLNAEIIESVNGLNLVLKYDEQRLSDRTVGRYLTHLSAIIDAIIADADRRVDQISLLSADERRTMLYDWNQIQAEPVSLCLHQQFEAQVRRAPQAVALVCGEQSLSYDALNRHANRLAHALIAQGVGPDMRVAICLPRGVEMVAAVLAVLKAGGGYVPIDPTYPAERIRYLLEDSAPLGLITQGSLWSPSPANVRLFDLEAPALLAGQPDSNPARSGMDPHQLAYVIYTSGSTGQPKGVMVEHAQVMRLFAATRRWFDFGADDVWSLFHSLSFDFSVWELWGALLHGGRLVVVSQETARAPAAFYQLLCEQGVTVLNQTPAAFRPLIAAQAAHSSSRAPALRWVIFGGEALEPAMLAPWYAQNGERATLVNMYGITETTVHVTFRRLSPADAALGISPIGERLPDLRIYVLDEACQPVPVGVSGELYVGGGGVARGYLNRTAMTAARFIDDPFVDEPGARLYKTGDRARWRGEGELEYLGRNDHQVKIRGFRIELGEIEARLRRHPAVEDGVVIARRENDGDSRLVAYYLASAPQDAQQLRDWAAAVLPDYMLPGAWVHLREWPLTANGKLDRRALPQPEGGAYAVQRYVAPQGETETALSGLWAGLLGVEQVGRHDHFFALGGHSLLAIQLLSRIRRTLNREVALSVLFARPVLMDFAQEVEDASFSALPPIASVARTAPLALSFAQQRLWFLSQLEAGASAAYHMAGGVRLQGDLDIDALQTALDGIVARHEALRTGFIAVDGTPYQQIHDPAPFALTLHDLRGHPDAESELARLSAAKASVPFDLTQGSLVRGHLVLLGERRQVLLFVMHHIISDGWSIGRFMSELGVLYDACVAGQASPLPPLRIQYADYAAWQRRWIEGPILQTQLSYWQQQLQGIPPLLALPTDRPRPAEQDYAGGRVDFTLDAALTAELKGLAARQGTTLYMTLLTGWAILLHRLSGQDDIVIGSPVAGRTRTELEPLIGLFVNTLVLRCRIADGATVGELLAQVKATTLAAQAHQDLPFEQLVEALNPVRSLAHSPLFQTMLAWQNAAGETLRLGELQGELFASEQVTAQFDLSLALGECGDRIEGGIEYASSLFDRETVTRYVEHWQVLLRAMARDAAQEIARLPLLSDAQRRQVLYDWNATDLDYPRGYCVHQLFEAQVARMPQAVALVYNEGKLSYDELNQFANRLAHALIAKGVVPDMRVAICLPRGVEMVVAVLAVLKAGGAYVPIDPSYPDDRIDYILEDSQSQVLVTHAALWAGRTAGIDILDPDSLDDKWPDTNLDTLALGLSPHHLAYVIYTSGSTGKPKGVMIEHRNLCHQVTALQFRYELSERDRILQFAPFTFDMSVEEIFGALCSRAVLVLRTDEWVSDASTFWRLCRRNAITVVNLPVVFWNTLIRDIGTAIPNCVRQIMIGGEAVSYEAIQCWYARDGWRPTLFNAYGPTEATVNATVHRIEPINNTGCIGRPLANTRVYVLDKNGEPASIGVAGELFIGGAGVARGYLNRDELTAACFVADPFVNQPDARMYKTGDRVRWYDDGSLEYLGRNDHQVKIRGFRIELGEIEARLRSHAQVADCVVTTWREGSAEARLVAYYLAPEPQDAVELRAWVAGQLPEYMLPAAWIHLAAWPLTSNGKLDRKALPVPDMAAYALQGYVAPQGSIETTLATLWADLLEVEQVGRYDNFFALGGHSLLAVQLLARMRPLALYADVSTLFKVPVLSDFAQSVSAQSDLADDIPENPLTTPQAHIVPEMLPLAKLGQEQIDGIVAAVPGGAKNVQDIYPLTSLQEGILFHHLLSPDSDPYVEITTLSFADQDALKRFLNALQTVVDRHDILRTAFVWQGLETPLQVVYRRAVLPVVEIANSRELSLDTHIDIRQAPLLHCRVSRDPADDRVSLELQTHQLAVDHTALDLMVAEIRAILGGDTSSLLPTTPFRHFVVHARREAQRGDHEAFFQQMLQAVTEPTAPFGHTSISEQRRDVQSARVLLDDRFAAQLRNVAQRSGVSVASVFHLAWALILARTSETDRPVFGTVLLGRTKGGEGIERAMGMFINTLPICIDIQGQTVVQALRQAHQRLAGLLDREHAPLALAQRCSSVLQPTPLFSSLLNFRHSQHSRIAGVVDLSGTGAAMLTTKERTHYPFTLNVDDTGQSFLVEVQVCGQVDPQRLNDYLHSALNSLVAAIEDAPDTSVQALAILPDAEKNTLLREWNATDADYARGGCFHLRFEAQAARTPQAVALMYGSQRLSYDALNRRANQLAHALIALGVTQNERVAICLPRGVEMVVAMLAVLKAGGAYIPIDPSYPAERIDYMLEDSQPHVAIVADDDGRGAAHAAHIINLNTPGDWTARSESNPEVCARHTDAAAYIIYTSGSTGRPKGVMVGHRALLNLLSSFDALLGLTAGDRWLAVTTIAFDIAALELFLPLLSGAAVVVASHAESSDPAWLEDAIHHLGITTMQATPATWRMLLDNGWSGHSALTALCGGEALNGALAVRLSTAVDTLWNVYGPTETTIWSTAQRVASDLSPHANVPIGRPIANTRVYVLDSARQLAPVGVAGELYIGGDGVAQGYLNQPGLTTERFIDDPFSAVPGGRLYKTGDRVRWRDDGALEYLGRNDHQVKIRGFRIELGEIEARLRSHVDVADAVVVARRESDADMRLVAYYLSPQPLAVAAMRDWVAEQLPDYMLPSAWVHLQAWPLTPNGKLDRRALPAPDSSAYQRQSYVAPQGGTETALAELWGDLLGVAQVGRDDHFFALGGHSLLAIQLLSRIRRALGREMTLNALFAQPVLADFAQSVEQAPRSMLPPIMQVDRAAPLALSFAQQRLWFLMQLEARVSAAYHIAGGVILSGALNCDALQAALDRVVVRHEVLRTRFVAVNGIPNQQVHSAEPFLLIRHDLRNSPDAEEALRRLAQDEAAMPFDVTQDGPIRGRLVRLDGQRHALLVTMHHLVSDGWSLARLMDELNVLYPAFCEGENDPLPPLAIQYADYAAWQRQWMQGGVLQTQLAYWREQLADVPPLLELPTDRPRPAAQDYVGGRVDFRLDAALTGELTTLAARHGATLYMTLLTSWAILLYRLSGQEDIVIGSPVAGRTRTELEPLIGFFVNTLALRCRVDGEATVATLLGQVKATMLAAQAHQDLPFEQLVEALNPTRSLAHSPLFQTLFIWQDAADDALRLKGLTAEPFSAGQVTTQFDLSMMLGSRSDCLEGSIEYASSLFERETVARYAEIWQVLLRALVRDEGLAVDQLLLLTKAQRQQVLYEWNATRKDYPNDRCLHQLIEAQIVRTPQAVALVYDNRRLSYDEMNRRANQLAHVLLAQGVGPDVRVAICLPRSLEMVVAVLAVLKAGGAYVPIDPAYPVERINYMLEDSEPRALIVSGDLPAQLPEGVVLIDLAHADDIRRMPASNPDGQGVQPHHLAYVIYTSGSTGKPKGVMIEHRAIVNRLMWMQDEYRLVGDDVVLQKTPLGFDVSVWELFWPLMVGVPLVLARHEGQKDPEYLAQLIQRQAVTTVHFVPPMLQAFLSCDAASRCDSLRRVICSGEGLGSALARQAIVRLPLAALFNLYGPTEAAVDVTAWPASGRDISPVVPIGRPIANTQTYVLDGLGQPVPVGVSGELYLGGVQLARGYLNRAALTAASFVADPFSGDPEARLYKTGDRVRWRADGVLEYLGRNDHQVKIRGFRIELGEIEVRLSAHDAIDDCVVAARREENGEMRLVAYYLAGETQEASELHGWLAEKLPDYMLPSAWVHLQAWPLTPNGKLDRRALPAPDLSAYQRQAYTAPQGEAEAGLAELWAELLGLEQIGRYDNFFTLGGHSLLAIQMVARIRHTQGREVALSALFTQPVLADFAGIVAHAPICTLPAITLVDRAGPLALSFAQQRLWFLTQLEARASAAYHVAGGLKLSGELDQEALRMALDRIVVRHEALRTRFVEMEGVPWQQIDEPAPFALAVHDLRGRPAASDELRQLADEEAAAPFDLQQGPPIRGQLIQLDEREQVLLVTMHHIVADGWSLGCFMRELGELYRAFSRQQQDPLAPLAIQYADYAAWQRRWMQGEELQAQLGYWREQLADVPPLLELPTDRPRPAVQDYVGGRIDFTLDAQLTSGLKALAARHGATLYMTLLAGWTLLLYRLSGQDDIVVGSPVAGRTRTELEPLIGFFVNTLALRNRVDGEASVGALLAQVKATTLAAQAHQDVPFEQLVEALNPTRSLSHNPLFQTMLAWQSSPDDALQLDGLQAEPYAGEQFSAKFDLLLSLEEKGAALSGSLEFAVSLFDRSTVARMVSHWRMLLHAMVNDDARPLAQLPLLADAERRQVLYDWNQIQAEPVSLCLHQQFEAQVRRAPQAVALVCGEQSLSYDALNRHANRLAHALIAQGVGPDMRVAICLPRGVEMVAAVLAVLKAGGGYVPIDPTYPAERIRYLLEDSAPLGLITQGSLWSPSPANVRLFDLEAPALLAGQPDSNPARSGTDPHQLAYVIYTSGSTGQPKGVMVEHAQVMRLFAATRRWFDFGADDVWSLFHSLSFDFSVWELWGALLHGGRLVVVSQETARAPAAFYQLLCEQGVTVLNQTPAAFRPLIAAQAAHSSSRAPALRWVIFGGEALEPAMLAPWYAQNGERATLVNMYGITETTVHVTFRRLSPADAALGISPIGERLPDLRIYVLDEACQPVPVGVSGELYVGGGGVARGYLNRTALTAARFIDDPFVDEPGARLYKTGDRARWRGEGELEYLGRNDHQVKIRGFRIELGEIEARLRRHPAVEDGVVIARRENDGDSRLVAYYLASAPQDAQQLRDWAAAVLPDYMLPGAWVHLREWPLTANGKLDRRALPQPEGGAYAVQRYVAPQGETETALSGLWAELLGVEQVGRHDHFFALGGHSLLAIQLLSRVRQILGRDVALGALFARPVLMDFAQEVEDASFSALPPIASVARTAPLALSFAQQRLWFLSQLEAGASAAYHMAGGVRLQGDLDIDALQTALDGIVARHEALRTGFIAVDGTPYQQIHEPASFALTLHDLRGHPDAESELARLSAAEASVPFDLTQGSLVRGHLVLLGERRQVLLFVMHHIISDGWSIGRFMSELGVLYDACVAGQASPLPPLRIQYADYAAWQRRWIEGPILQTQLSYWQQQLQGIPPLLVLPTDRPRPAVQDYAGGRVDFTLDAALTAELKGLAARQGSTLYMTLLTGWAILLHRLSGQDDIVIGSPVAGRTRTELEPLIGFFVNTLALRCRIADGATVGELLAQVKATTLAAQAHQDLPFEQLVEALNPVRSLAHSPLFQTMLAWQEDNGPALALQGVRATPFTTSQVTAKFDLLLALEAVGDRIEGSIEYASSLFDRKTVERYVGYLQRLLRAMVRDAAQEIARLPLLSDAQRRQVLYDWNETRTDYPREQGIHQLFEAQVERTPQAVALVHNEGKLSYDELNQFANRLAHALIAKGMVPDMRVAICLPRGVEMVVAVLAVLKAGGAYVPIDPSYPDDRIRYMLHDGRPRVLITDASLAPRLPTDEDRILLVLPERLTEAWTQLPTNNPVAPLSVSPLAYVIYTSGSTGQPKGVAMPHRALVNLMHWQRRAQEEKTTPRTLQYAALGFDVSFQEIFSTLLFGGELVLIDESSRLDMIKLSALIRQRQIERLYLPYVALKALAAQLQTETQPIAALQEIITAGEQLVITASLQQLFAGLLSHVRLYNHYGPTETHVASCFDLPSVAQEWVRFPSIGRPIANTRIYLLDALQQPVPIGVSGEIYLAGDAVACGYLNNPVLTAERFLPDPFVLPAGNEPQQRMYRTGDIGRWNEDGTIAYLGRGDRQIKIRGFRVELEEIEAQLNTYAGIAQSLVVLREDDPDNSRLVAYFLPDGEENAACKAETLHQYLTSRLPEYMVPAAYVPVSRFPVSPNGKLDRNALPAPDAASYVSQEYDPPQGEVEQILADMWSELLQVERVGRRDHFFALGGHSLLAVQLVSRIKNRLMIEVPLQDVFAVPQLHRMADLLLQHIDTQLHALMSKEDSFDQR